MTGTRVKICGLTNAADVDTAVTAGADALGFIVDVPVDTPREITVQTAATLIADTPPFVTTVLVTMADSADAVAALANLTDADAVQLHGRLADEALDTVTATLDIPVIASIDPTTTTDLSHIADHADAILLDTDEAGGTGTTHDWDTAHDIVTRLDTPVILAGGLTPDNVADAVRTTTPFAVDVATGVEATGGTKDPAAVQSFIETATTVDTRS